MCLPVCLSVTWLRCANTAEPIEVLFGVETLEDPRDTGGCEGEVKYSAGRVSYRPPPAPAVADTAANTTTEIPVVVEQPPTSTALNDAGATATTSGTTGPPVLGVQTNPELPSPARVRWMDAFSRVCAHLNQVRATQCTFLVSGH